MIDTKYRCQVLLLTGHCPRPAEIYIALFESEYIDNIMPCLWLCRYHAKMSLRAGTVIDDITDD
jgi:hypothetical protein